MDEFVVDTTTSEPEEADDRPPSSSPGAQFGATGEQWDDWRWQLRNRIRDLDSLEKAFTLTDDERSVVEAIGGRLPVGITPYYASLVDANDPNDPIRRTIIPLGAELLVGPGEAADPLGEDHDSAVPGLVHRYPDRVLFLVTNFCAVYCRYCTRARLVGHTGEFHFSLAQHKKALDYIASHPEIRDVLVSGGDPLTMADDRLDQLFGAIRAIPHVEFVRVGSKVPAVLPQRITPALVKVLRKHRVWLSMHAMHPREITPEFRAMADRLADGGIPIGSQTVLLKGVNDEVPVMKKLMTQLLTCRIRPYYIYQCDPIHGSAHLRTTVSKGLEIIAGLRGHTTGYAVPAYVIDGPGGGGKIQLMPDAIVGRDGDDLLLRNFEGGIYRYPDPQPQLEAK